MDVMTGTGVRETVIAPRSGLNPVNVAELYRHRELLYLFVWRDIKVRYKQSVLGVAWIALKPLATMAIMTVVFGRLARLPSEGVPYAVFVLLGLIPWGYFSSTFSASTNSIVAASNLIGKVYFPRLLIPIGSSLSMMVDVLVSFSVLLAVMLVYGMVPPAKAVFTPAIIVLAGVTALGPGLFFAALNVKYRDVGQIAPFMIQLWMYATPVIYPVGLVPADYRWLMYLNPVSGIVDSFRACMMPGKLINWELFGVSASVSLAMFAAGLYYFASVERSFADNI